jgi:hypothetical protein
MAFNIVMQFEEEPNFSDVHALIYQEDYTFDIFPVVDEEKAFYGLGISIPSDDFNEITWKRVVTMVVTLQGQFSFTLFDLIQGNVIEDITTYDPR